MTALEHYANRLHARAVRVCEAASSLEALRKVGILREGAVAGVFVNGEVPEICKPAFSLGGEPPLFFLEDAVHGEHLRVPDVRSLAAAAH